jgi:hypothetical protein
MRHIFSRRPSPAMVVACVALLFALAPASYATVSRLVPRSSIGTAELKSNAVTSEKVRDFSLRAWDFRKTDLPRGERAARAAGTPGSAGRAGHDK